MTSRQRLLPADSVASIKGVGEKTAKHLQRLGIATVEDLLNHFPHRYLDLATVKKIRDVREGEDVTVYGSVRQIKKWRARSGLLIVAVAIYDGTGYLHGVWFNQEFMSTRFAQGDAVAFSGRVNFRFGQLQIQNPLFDVIQEEDISGGTAAAEDVAKGNATGIAGEYGAPVHTGRIVPLHPATQGLSSTAMRRIVRAALDAVDPRAITEPIPDELRASQGFADRATAIENIHFPTDSDSLRRARERLLFEELFLMQVGLAVRKRRLERETKGVEHRSDGALVRRLYDALPFELTADQRRVIAEITRDMESARPMNRLLQGEVGSGKTVVALTALLIGVQSGYQGALMTPTEVLGEQHYLNLQELVLKAGASIALLTGSTAAGEKAAIAEGLRLGEIDLVVGTHSLIQQEVDFQRLGIAVIDEQHRFGVRQRIHLRQKGYRPDVLVMSATPIPRTLALTLYGDLDVSIIRERPGGRQVSDHVETLVLDKTHRPRAYDLIRREVSRGRQAFIVCPLIEESDKLAAKAVLNEAARLEAQEFSGLRVGLIHGRLGSAEKQQTMADFREGRLDVLISTTVIEVGVDVANATVMLVEDAERFGLAQLHQLRGRVGRGSDRSYFVLFGDPSTDEARERLKAIAQIRDGFDLAEADLRIRGEGQIFGPRQSGLPDLRLAQLSRDIEVVVDAREEAFRLVDEDPRLERPDNQELLNEVKRRFAASLDWLFAG